MEKMYKTGIYLRLSKGDRDDGGRLRSESDSIANQRLIVQHYLEEHQEMKVVREYVDDGFTGLNYDRPQMRQLLKDIDDQKIDCVIVKDLSRFGREHIQTQQFILQNFKEKGVRFIAISDSYDSMTADSCETHLVMPVKALTNDTFSRDISAKVRASQTVKRERGECIAPFAPYGYQKDPKNHNHLIPDPEAALVVQNIYRMRMSGMTANAIVKELKDSYVYTPSIYKKKHGSTYKGPNFPKNPYAWTTTQVLRILEDEVYIGSIVQGRVSKVNYKIKKLIHHPREAWCVVPNMHEPIISKSDFDIVQSLLKRDSMKLPGGKASGIFGGLLFCGDCGKSMVRRVRRRKMGDKISFICSGYNKGENCSSHEIEEKDLKEIIITCLNERIKKMCRYGELAKNLDKINVSQEEAVLYDKKIMDLNAELEKCGRLKAALYQDLKEGILDEKQFDRYRQKYTEQEIELGNAIAKQKEIIANIYKNGLLADDLLERFKENAEVKELDRILLVSLVDKILIYDGNVVELVYRYRDEIETLNDILEAKEKQDGKDK